MYKIIEKTKIWFSISLIVILIGIGGLIKNGLNFGIDFKGGTEISIEMGKAFSKEEVDEIVKKYDADASSNTVNETQMQIKSSTLTTESTQKLIDEVKTKYSLKEDAFTSTEIGKTIGSEMAVKALQALGLAVVLMLFYIRIRFKDFTFGLAAIIALVHDVLTTIALYSVFQLPVNSPFIAAMLTVIGYSINDTIVIFDRIRENLGKLRGRDVVEVANISVTQTFARSINTVLTVLIMLIAVHVFVPAVRSFTMPMLAGIISGCYSSIFIASPLWVIFKKMSKKKRAVA